MSTPPLCVQAAQEARQRLERVRARRTAIDPAGAVVAIFQWPASARHRTSASRRFKAPKCAGRHGWLLPGRATCPLQVGPSGDLPPSPDTPEVAVTEERQTERAVSPENGLLGVLFLAVDLLTAHAAASSRSAPAWASCGAVHKM